MQPDIEKYLPLFDKFDITKEQKINHIHMLWNVAGQVAYRAFGLDSTLLVSQAKEWEVADKPSNLLKSSSEAISTAFNRNDTSAK